MALGLGVLVVELPARALATASLLRPLLCRDCEQAVVRVETILYLVPCLNDCGPYGQCLLLRRYGYLYAGCSCKAGEDELAGRGRANVPSHSTSRSPGNSRPPPSAGVRDTDWQGRCCPLPVLTHPAPTVVCLAHCLCCVLLLTLFFVITYRSTLFHNSVYIFTPVSVCSYVTHWLLRVHASLHLSLPTHHTCPHLHIPVVHTAFSMFMPAHSRVYLATLVCIYTPGYVYVHTCFPVPSMLTPPSHS